MFRKGCFRAAKLPVVSTFESVRFHRIKFLQLPACVNKLRVFPIIAPHEIIAPHYGIITMMGGL